tara:strand:+ start:29 stop:643 length:615 start_codon:yes stop_codon:yes gene_type:complete
MSGDNCSLICENGVDTDGIVMSGNFGYHDGGGWDTLHDGGTANHAVDISGDDVIVRNFSAQTTAAGGTAYDGVHVAGARATVSTAKFVDSDDQAVHVAAGGDDCLIESCTVLDADSIGVFIQAPRSRIINNRITVASSEAGIDFRTTGDDGLAVGNIVQVGAGDPIAIDANNDNCVVVGNRTDGAVADNSGSALEENLNVEIAF